VKLLRVTFSQCSAHLSPGEDLQHVFPDVDGSRALQLLHEVARQVTGNSWLDDWHGLVKVHLRHLDPDTARRIREEYERALLAEQQRLAGLAAVLGDPRQPQQQPEERAQPEPEEVEVLPWPPDPQEEAERLRQEVEDLLSRRRRGEVQATRKEVEPCEP
jgi:hypothetical protein